MELRPFLSDPELMGAGDGSSHISVAMPRHDGGYQTLPSRGRNIEEPGQHTNVVWNHLWVVLSLHSCTHGHMKLKTVFNNCWPPSSGSAGSSLRMNHSSSISSYVTLRRSASAAVMKVRLRKRVKRMIKSCTVKMQIPRFIWYRSSSEKCMNLREIL